ncbi:MAG: ribosome recycling factor [Elusimicrobia bacterium CG08_land_8_20_14_0_20_51_18]|nr:MAG: ribosome recycling factor [Elusimicrobia bacterium CG08_land_8_20_14_0_20_51_18]
MEDINELVSMCEMEMGDKIEKFKRELTSLRTGRANPQLLDNIYVEYYGAKVPLKQIAAVSIPEPRTLEVRPWDKGAVDAIETELKKADLGTNPTKHGDVIRINLPPMNEDQRKKMVKMVAKMAEDSRVAIRNERRDTLEKIKKAQKTGEISEDDYKRQENNVQKITDNFVKNVDAIAQEKEKELLTV